MIDDTVTPTKFSAIKAGRAGGAVRCGQQRSISLSLATAFTRPKSTNLDEINGEAEPGR